MNEQNIGTNRTDPINILLLVNPDVEIRREAEHIVLFLPNTRGLHLINDAQYEILRIIEECKTLADFIATVRARYSREIASEALNLLNQLIDRHLVLGAVIQ
jgi:hypothetical protein